MVDASEARALGLRSIGEVARSLGTTVRTIQYYEEEGLVSPRRTPGGTRFFSEFDVRRLAVCVRLSGLGYPMRTLRTLALTRPGAESGSISSRSLAGELSTIRRQAERDLAVLTRLIDDLDIAEELVRACWDCPNPPTREGCPDCPCEQQLDRSDLVHLIWDADRGADA